MTDQADFCIERNSVVKTKMLSRIWERAQLGPVQLLDVGCGNAEWLVPLLDAVDNVAYHAVEPQERLVAQARANLPRFAADIRVAGGEGISAEFGKRFDMVISRDALEHVYLRESFLDQICGAVDDGGWLLLTYGTDHFKQGIRTDARNAVSQLLARMGTKRYYTSPVDHTALLGALESNGLRLHDSGYYSLREVKSAHKLIDDPSASRDALMRWLDLEEYLNREGASPERLSALSTEAYFDARRGE